MRSPPVAREGARTIGSPDGGAAGEGSSGLGSVGHCGGGGGGGAVSGTNSASLSGSWCDKPRRTEKVSWGSSSAASKTPAKEPSVTDWAEALLEEEDEEESEEEET